MTHSTSLLLRSIWIASLLVLLNAAVLPAQEAFPATHVLLYSLTTDADTIRGVGIAAIDHETRSLDYRVSFGPAPIKVTSAMLIRYHGLDDGEADTGFDTLLTVPIGSTEITFTGTMPGLSIDIIGAIDSGTAELHFSLTNTPEESLGASLEMIPSAYADNMRASEETTPPTGAENAGGRAQMTVHLPSRTALYKVEWYNLTGPATAAHFHRGARGVAGPPIHTITLTGDSTILGVWAGMSEADLESLAKGEVYINVHTALNSGGEIRKQMEPVEVFVAAIEPSNEVPPVIGSPMSGTGVVVLQTSSSQGTFLTTRSVVGPNRASMAHIHRGAKGAEGDVLMPLEREGHGMWVIEEDRVTSANDLALIRAGNTYLNFHTETNLEGEARGQLIPSASNLTGIPVSSVPVPGSPLTSNHFGASLDSRTGEVRFMIAPEAGTGERRIILYDVTGSSVADLAATGNHATLDIRDLPAGFYFARLFVGGDPAGSAKLVLP